MKTIHGDEYTNRAYLLIVSTSLTPEQMAAKFPIEFDESYYLGKPKFPGANLFHEFNSLVLHAENKIQSIDISDYIDNILSRIVGIKQSFGSNSSQCSYFLNCVIEANNVPPLHFEVPLISKLADLNIALDIDLYIK